jgi:conjugative transfer region lipoprotein (TIGR03751 family)
MNPWILRTALISGLVAVLSACSTIPEPEDDGLDMREVYDQKVGGGAIHTTPQMAGGRALVEPDPDYSAYTRQVQNETDSLFPALPNPTLYLYVRPRTVGTDGLPVPGYTVPFKLWPRDIYGMPGEAPTANHRLDGGVQ